jgi:hypothetical protein
MLGRMRFRVEVEVCVEVDSVEEVDELETRLEEAVVEAVGDRHIPDPEHGSISGGSVEGLDAESHAALEAAAPVDE